jgi:hypothetical protein
VGLRLTSSSTLSAPRPVTPTLPACPDRTRDDVRYYGLTLSSSEIDATIRTI